MAREEPVPYDRAFRKNAEPPTFRFLANKAGVVVAGYDVQPIGEKSFGRSIVFTRYFAAGPDSPFRLWRRRLRR